MSNPRHGTDTAEPFADEGRQNNRSNSLDDDDYYQEDTAGISKPAAATGGAEAYTDDDNNNNTSDGEKVVERLRAEDIRPISEHKRFLMMSVACLAMVCASTSYAYNLISLDIQTTYGLSFRDMSSINTVGMCFCYFLLPYGFIFDFFGPKPLYVLGCILFPLGALMFGLTFQGVIKGTVVRFAVFNAMLSLGSQLFDLATVIVMMSVFPTRRGWVIALLKTIMGLGQAVIGSIKAGFFSTTTEGYFYFLLGMVVVVGILVLALITLPPYHLTQWEERRLSAEKKRERRATRGSYLTQHPPMWRFYYGIIVLCVLIVYLPTTTAVAAFVGKRDDGTVRLGVANYRRPVAIVAIILTLFLMGMMLPIRVLDRMTTAPREDLDSATEVATDIDYIAPQYQTSFWRNCLTLRLWCILFTMFCGVGSEFVIIFNANYIYSALAKSSITNDNTVSTLLTVINGCGSALGRLLMSAWEIYSQGRRAEDRIPITVSFFVPTACIIVAIVLFLVLPGRSLLLAFSVASIGNGFCASVSVLVLRTIYAKDPAKHYNFGFNALWLSGVFLNRLLFGEWYYHMANRADKKAQRGSSPFCLGRDCVMMPLLVMLGLNCVAFLSNIYLHIKYVLFSRGVLAERLRIKQEAEAAAAARSRGGNNNNSSQSNHNNNNNDAEAVAEGALAPKRVYEGGDESNAEVFVAEDGGSGSGSGTGREEGK